MTPNIRSSEKRPLSRFALLVALVLLSAAPVARLSPVALFADPALGTLPIVAGDTWRYLKGTAAPPANWNTAAFDHSAWATGPGGFGYGDGDDATVLSDMQNGYVSVYIRRLFDVSNPNTISGLTFTVDYDDGFVAYLNGTEVVRRNVSGTPPSYNATATASHEASAGSGGNPPETISLNAYVNLLVAGTNVLAIQGHNVSLTSTDFSLIPSLQATNPPPTAPAGPDSPANGATGVSSNPSLCVTVNDPNADLMNVTFKGREATPSGKDFTIIVLPDAQYYPMTYPDVENTQMQWIVANRVARNIVYVSAVGDSTNDNNSAQWTNVSTAFAYLENPITTGLPSGIPYGITLGNHDQTPVGTARTGTDEGATTTLYNQTFGKSRFCPSGNCRSYFGENYTFGGDFAANMDNYYQLFNADGMEFIAFHIEWDQADNATRQAVLAWMRNILLNVYPNRRAMITTHYLINPGDASWSDQGLAVYNAVRDVPSVFAMFCGHLDQANMRTDTYNGHTIYTMVSDYQSRPNGGNGWLRILTFTPADNSIHVQTYSPYVSQFINNHADNVAGTAKNDFTLPYTMSGGGPFETIGTVSGVANGGQACASWPSRQGGKQYEWYVDVSDGTSTTSSPRWTFTPSCASGADCNDANICTTDACNAGVCTHTAVAGCGCSVNADCDNGNACDGVETCAVGVCLLGTSPNCNDGNLCTTDSCDPATGCVYTNNTVSCSDGNTCTSPDACSGGACLGAYLPVNGCCFVNSDCKDGNPATIDRCTGSPGFPGNCTNLLSASCQTNADCADEDACTTETCSVSTNTANAAALSFNGSNAYVTFGNPAELRLPQFTIETWFKRMGTGTPLSTGSGGVTVVPLVAKGSPEGDGSNVDANYILGINTTSNVLAADFEQFEKTCTGGTGTCTTAPYGANCTCTANADCQSVICGTSGLNRPVSGITPIVNGTWYHAAATYDGTTWRLYLDGNLEATLAFTGTVTPRYDSIQPAALGTMIRSGGTTNGFFQGILDEVRIWSYARSEADIQRDKSRPLTSGTGLIGRWGLDEGTGTSIADSVGPPNTSGTLTNGPAWVADHADLGPWFCAYVTTNCSDGNPCTLDVCDGGSCAHPIDDDGTPCNDGNSCTSGDACVSGLCQAGTPIPGCCVTGADCNDADACTTDSCANGVCLSWYAPTPGCCASAGNCNDGNATTNDTCVGAPGGNCSNVVSGACTTAAQCNDSNGCTTDACNGFVGGSDLHFDGTNDYVTMGAAAGETALGARAFTLEGWIRRDGPTWGTTTTTGTGGMTAVPLITKGRGESESAPLNTNYFLGITTAGRPVADFEQQSAAGGWAIGQNHPICSTGSITDQNWHHVAVTYSVADGWRLYLDGVEGTTTEGSSCATGNACSPLLSCPRVPGVEPEYNSTQHFALGSALTSNGTRDGLFAGIMDEARVWNVVRTPAQIAAGMNLEISSGTGLIGRWGFNEASGMSAADSTVPTANGTLTESTVAPVVPANGPAWTAESPVGSTPGTCTNTSNPNCLPCAQDYQCNDGNSCTSDYCSTTNDAALQFDGTDDYVTMGAAAGTSQLGAATFTVETSFYWTGGGVGQTTGGGGIASLIPLVAKGSGEGETPANVNENYILGITGGRLAGDFEDTASGLNHPVCTSITQPTITTNVWHHAAATYDGTSWKLYLDGAALPIDTACSSCTGLACTVSPGATPEFTSIQHFALGGMLTSTGARGAGAFQGRMDEVRVWNVARSLAQIQADQFREVSSAPNLIGRWSLNEGTATTAADSSGRGNNGTLTNGTAWSTSPLPFVGTDACAHANLANGASCSDDNSCTLADACNGTGQCIGNPMDCDDHDACTTDSCSGGACLNAASCGVGGTVYYYRTSASGGSEPSTKPVPNVDIDRTQDAVPDVTTGSSGNYAFGSLFGDVTLTALPKNGAPRAADHNDAITSMDAAGLAMAAVGNGSLSVNQKLAGDVTGNGTTSALDASLVARFAVGLVDHFPVATARGSDWKLLRCDTYPGGCGDPVYAFTPLGRDETAVDFYAILYGDVTGDWTPAAGFVTSRATTSPEERDALIRDRALVEQLKRTGAPPVIERRPGMAAAELSLTGWKPLRAGERGQLTVDLRNADGILGLDLVLRYDPSSLAIVNVEGTGIGSALTVARADRNGTQKIAAYGYAALSGSGSILTITVEGLRNKGRQQPPTIDGMANEGAVPLRVQQRSWAPRGSR